MKVSSFALEMKVKHIFLVPVLFGNLLFGQATFETIKSTALEIKADSAGGVTHIANLISPYNKSMHAEMNVVLVKSAEVLEKGQPESKLGNLVTDICRKSALIPSDICVLNNGGLRATLPAGEITVGRVFELMPFDNEIVVLTITGDKMLELFNYIANSNGIPVSGLKASIGKNGLEDIEVNGFPFDPKKEYRVCTSDYLANSGDKMSFFLNPIKTEKTGVLIRNALIETFRKLGNSGELLQSKIEGRITVSG